MHSKISGIFRKWWLFFLVGFISAAFGAIIKLHPGTGFETARIAAVIEFMSMGALFLSLTLSRRERIPAWGWNFCAGLILMALAIMTAAIPNLSGTLIIVLYIISFFFDGIFGILGSKLLRKLHFRFWKWPMALSIVTLLAGVLLIFFPKVAAVSIDLLVPMGLISFGTSMMLTGFAFSKIRGKQKAAGR